LGLGLLGLALGLVTTVACERGRGDVFFVVDAFAWVVDALALAFGALALAFDAFACVGLADAVERRPDFLGFAAFDAFALARPRVPARPRGGVALLVRPAARFLAIAV
jgi:hypothetical protein